MIKLKTKKFILDSNFIVSLLFPSESRHLTAVKIFDLLLRRNQELVVLAETLAEVRRVGDWRHEDREEFQRAYGDFVSNVNVIPSNEALRKKAVNFQQKYDLGYLDSLLAATAKEHGYAVITADWHLLKIPEIDALPYMDGFALPELPRVPRIAAPPCPTYYAAAPPSLFDAQLLYSETRRLPSVISFDPENPLYMDEGWLKMQYTKHGGFGFSAFGFGASHNWERSDIAAIKKWTEEKINFISIKDVKKSPLLRCVKIKGVITVLTDLPKVTLEGRAWLRGKLKGNGEPVITLSRQELWHVLPPVINGYKRKVIVIGDVNQIESNQRCVVIRLVWAGGKSA